MLEFQSIPAHLDFEAEVIFWVTAFAMFRETLDHLDRLLVAFKAVGADQDRWEEPVTFPSLIVNESRTNAHFEVKQQHVQHV